MVDPKGILETPKRTVYPSVYLATWDCARLLLSHVSCADHGLNRIVKHVQSCESISCIRSYCATILPSLSDDNCFSETERFAIACFRYLRRTAPQKDAAQRTRDKNRGVSGAQLVSSPDPTYERGSGDIWLIPRASLFSGEKFLSANHIAENTI